MQSVDAAVNEILAAAATSQASSSDENTAAVVNSPTNSFRD